MVFMPFHGHSLEVVVERGVGLIMALSLWNVSVWRDGELNKTEVAGLVRVGIEKVTCRMAHLTAHLEALIRGLPITLKMKPKEDAAEEEEQQASDLRSGKETVLRGHKDAVAAKVVLNVDKGRGATTTRAGSSTDAEAAAELERQTQDKALERAKRRREEDEAKAAAAASAPKRGRGPGLRGGRKETPEKKNSKRGKEAVDLGGTSGGAESSDQE